MRTSSSQRSTSSSACRSLFSPSSIPSSTPKQSPVIRVELQDESDYESYPSAPDSESEIEDESYPSISESEFEDEVQPDKAASESEFEDEP